MCLIMHDKVSQVVKSSSYFLPFSLYTIQIIPHTIFLHHKSKGIQLWYATKYIWILLLWWHLINITEIVHSIIIFMKCIYPIKKGIMPKWINLHILLLYIHMGKVFVKMFLICCTHTFKCYKVNVRCLIFSLCYFCASIMICEYIKNLWGIPAIFGSVSYEKLPHLSNYSNIRLWKLDYSYKYIYRNKR